MSLSVAFCNRISPRALASRSRIGLAETSTMLASPRASRCVRLFNCLLPLLHYSPHLFGGIEPRFDVLEAVPREQAQQIGRHQDLAVAVRAGADADGRYGQTARQF